MYNEEVKKAFIDFAKADSYTIESVALCRFGQSEKLEKKFDKDVCNWTIEEILTFYKTFCTPSIDFLMIINSLFKRYTYFCIEKGLVLDCQNHYEEAGDYQILEGCLNTSLEKKQIYSREELLKELQNFINPCDQFEILAMFEGIYDGYQDIYYFKLEDVDKDMIATLRSGKKVKISKELYNYAIESKNSYEYVCLSSNKIATRMFDADDEGVIKRYYNWTGETNPRQILQRLGRRVNRFNSTYGTYFTSKNLIESGRIETLKKYMKEDNISGNDFYDWWFKKDEAFRKSIDNTYGYIPSMNRWVTKYGKYL